MIGRGNAALSLLDGLVFCDTEFLIDLLLDFAVAAVPLNLIDLCNTYQHDLEDEALIKSKAS